MTPPSESPAGPPEKLTLAATAPRAPRSEPTAAAPARPRRLKSQPLTVRGWVLRVLVGGLLIGSAVLVQDSYRRLLPVQREARETAALVSRLSAEVALMETRHSPEQTEEVAREYARAQGLLFSTPEALKDWFQQVREQMVPLALDATADFGRPSTTNAAHYALAIVPATLALSIQPAPGIGAVRTPYERTLRFLTQLGLQEKRVDLVELQVSGGTNSVSRAVATLQLWAGEDRPQ